MTGDRWSISGHHGVSRLEKEHRIASYNKGCRCQECREAARKARARQRANAKTTTNQRKASA